AQGARRPRARLAIIGGAAVSVLTVSGVAAASTSAVPGDALYDVKRSTERAQIALAGSDVNSGALYLEFARTRIAEADAVRRDPQSLVNVLRDMDRQTREGVSLLDSTAVSRRDAASLEQVGEFVNHQRPEVLELLHGTDGDAQERVRRSLSLIDEVEQRRADLHRLLLCTAGKPVQSDKLGPLPQDCSALPGSSATPPAGQGSGRATGPSSGQSKPDASSGTEATDRPGGADRPHPSASGPAQRTHAPDVPGAPPLPRDLAPSTSGSPAPGDDSNQGGGLFGILGKILGGLL
ncbi:MAG: DUF5667 domain-containing protein, partial [Actinocatenispora sp.]